MVSQICNFLLTSCRCTEYISHQYFFCFRLIGYSKCPFFWLIPSAGKNSCLAKIPCPMDFGENLRCCFPSSHIIDQKPCSISQHHHLPSVLAGCSFCSIRHKAFQIKLGLRSREDFNGTTEQSQGYCRKYPWGHYIFKSFQVFYCGPVLLSALEFQFAYFSTFGTFISICWSLISSKKSILSLHGLSQSLTSSHAGNHAFMVVVPNFSIAAPLNLPSEKRNYCYLLCLFSSCTGGCLGTRVWLPPVSAPWYGQNIRHNSGQHRGRPVSQEEGEGDSSEGWEDSTALLAELGNTLGYCGSVWEPLLYGT